MLYLVKTRIFENERNQSDRDPGKKLLPPIRIIIDEEYQNLQTFLHYLLGLG